jgi:UDP-GlcNAc:undecaprenyl-phosphate GlcNAc-1-phosphate transferase
MVRLGGVSIFLGTLTSLLLVWATGGFIDATGQHLAPPEEFQIWGVTIGGLAFFLIGLMDDLFGLSALSRLIMQAGVADHCLACGGQHRLFNHSLLRAGSTARLY